MTPDPRQDPAAEFDQVLALAAVGYWRCAPGGDAVNGSPGLAALLGCSADDLPVTRDAWLALAHPEDVAAFAGLLVGAAAGRSTETEVRLRHGGGNWRWFACLTRPVGDDALVVCRDVTDRKRDDEELARRSRQLEEQLRERSRLLAETRDSLAQIIDGSPVPTLVLDADHVVSHWNRACERIIGIPAADMIGTRGQWRAFYSSERPIMADLVMSRDPAAIERLYGGSYRRSKVVDDAFEAEAYFARFGRWLFFTAAPLRDNTGRVIGAIETLQDVSERKQAELALIDAKKVAESAAQAKAAFLANISHEIRTPMNAVIGLAHLLLRSELSPRQHDYVTRIQGAGKLLLGLINDVLDFSKIEAGRLHLEAAEFALDDVLSDVASVVLEQAQAKGLELHYVVEPNVPPYLIGDPLRLSQVLINLVGNAIKFTARGSVTVHFRLDGRHDATATLVAEIQDTGIGISAEQQRNLFQAFSQADGSITRRYGGSGLGLTICQRLVELMGGSIAVASAPGAGSTFTFSARFGIGQGDAVPAKAAAGPRVLVVDDNPLARVVLQRLLQKFGCTTATAESGEEALALLEAPAAPRYDCIALDLNMPGMDGLALAHAIRARLTPVPRLVMVTASDTNTLENAAALGEFDAIINKPLTAAQIGKLVESLAHGAAPPATVGATASGQAPLAGMRLLVVEDIATNRLIITETLAGYGATVDTADNGREAVQRLQAPDSAYDAVLMDIQMPEMDGLEATRRIRSGRGSFNIPIIAMTAHAFEEERRRCYEVGMNDFITKPIDPELLIKSLLPWKPAVEPPSPMPATPDPAAGLPPLPGIDTAEGLRRMMNKTRLYERVLRDFQQRFSDEAARIRADLQAGDRESARRRAHSTKGLAGSIGAAALQEASLALEKAIAEEEKEVEPLIAAFAAELATVIDGIAAGLGPA